METRPKVRAVPVECTEGGKMNTKGRHVEKVCHDMGDVNVLLVSSNKSSINRENNVEELLQ
jgi:hypothetical protein